MFRHVMLAAASLTALAGATASADPTLPQDAAIGRIEEGYIGAWKQSDANLLAANFTDDGDFISPTGFHAAGRAAIGAFYAQVFAAGYSDSEAGFTPRLERRVAPGVVVIDGEWHISGARLPDGGPREREHGLATAVLIKTDSGWRISALREQSSGSKIQP